MTQRGNRFPEGCRHSLRIVKEAIVKLTFRRRYGFFLLALSCVRSVYGQTSSSMTQTVAQRNTIGVTTVAPTGTLPLNATATFSYVLHTAGAPAPTSETIQFYDGGTAIGSAQSIGSLAAANLLPYAQVDPAHGWSTTGTAPTITINTGNGPDGSSSTATQIAFPDTTSGTSGVSVAVTGTSYASMPMTLSVWARSSSGATLTLALGDSPRVAAAGSTACSVTSTWQRCTFTYTFPSGSGTGFAATLSSSGTPAQTVSVWGAQVEQAATAGPFVSTIGTARPTGGQGGSVSFAYSALQPGSHTITAVYAGDANFVASTSNAVAVAVSKASPTIALTPSPASPATYGQAVTLSAAVTPPGSVTGLTPTGSVQFFDGMTSLGTSAVNGSGNATLMLSGPTLLAAGTHSITAVYSGDSNFNTITSAALPYVVNKAASAVAAISSLNPSIYGDTVTFTIQVSSSAGAVPTGTVLCKDGSTTLGTVTLSGSGAATITVPLLTAGTHTVSFTYSGDSNYH